MQFLSQARLEDMTEDMIWKSINTNILGMVLVTQKFIPYAAYPLGYYKAITLNDDEQKRVLEILCKITGLTEEQLDNLPKDYFPAVTGSIIPFDAMSVDENGSLSTTMGSMADTESEDDRYEHFISQVTYEHVKELMWEMENIIGEKSKSFVWFIKFLQNNRWLRANSKSYNRNSY